MGDNVEGTNLLSGAFGAADAVVDMKGYGVPATVTVIPGSGCTVKVQTSTSGNAATATWVDWPSGGVAVNTADAIVSPVSLVKFIRTAGAVESTYEICA